MNACPPKPGFTDITRIRSTRSITGSIVAFGCGRVERDARLLAQRADGLQRPVQMRPRLDVDRDDVGAGLGERLEVGIARRDHQVDVEGLLACAVCSAFTTSGPMRDVGDEMAVHHVDMDPVGTGAVDGAQFLAQLGKVGGQDRRRNDERARHFGLRSGAIPGASEPQSCSADACQAVAGNRAGSA